MPERKRRAVRGKRKPGEVRIRRSWLIQVACRDEADQRALYQRLYAEGRKLRVLTV